MNKQTININDEDLNRTIMQIGYLGAFYGLTEQAQNVFHFYQQDPHDNTTKIAAALGHALIQIGKKNYQQITEQLEEFLETHHTLPDNQLLEIKAFLALAYKKSKTRADRVETLLNDLKHSSSDAIVQAAQIITES